MTKTIKLENIDINLSKKETDIHRTSGLHMLHGRKLAVVDEENICLVPATPGSVSRGKLLNLRPPLHDITYLDNETVIITSYGEEKLYYVSMRSSLKLVKSVKVRGQCRGIARINDSLVVTYDKPVKVEKRSANGKKLICNIVDVDKGKNLFTSPWYVAASLNQTIIYVSDYGEDTITSLSLKGEVLAKYRGRDTTLLKAPRGITVDRNGNVYVCGFNTNNIVQLLADLSEPRQLPEEAVNQPRSIYYNETDDTLYVGDQSKSIHVYRLK